MNLARFALSNGKVIVFAVLVLSLFGLRAYLVAPQSIFPAMSFSRVDVVADAGDLPPDRVRVGVTRPLEQAFQTLPAVTDVQTISSQGTAELFVTFASSTSPQTGVNLVNQAVAQVRADIPQARSVVAVPVDPNREPVLSYALTSRDLSPAVLRSLAQSQIAPRLYGTPGLASVLVAGGTDTEFHVDLDPARLSAHGLAAGDVSRALAEANNVTDVGSVDRDYQRYAVLIDSALHDRTSLAAVQIPTKDGNAVPLGDLGTIALGTSPPADETSVDGRDAVILNAYALPGADTVKMAGAVRARFATVAAGLPRDIAVTPFWDETSLIVASQAALRDAILLGALLAIIVIYAFLRSVQLTLVAAAVIPLAMAITLLVVERSGQTLNLMSVGGLAVAVGLIIDDAIVVVENIARHRREKPGRPLTETIVDAMQQLTPAMIASTTTTVVVFLPLALLTGVTGFFFRALAFTLATALIVSLGLALFVAPVVARALLARRAGVERDPASRGFTGRYVAVLRWALAHRPIVGLGSVAVLAVTIALLAHLPSDFLPNMDEGQFEIGYTLPVGTTLAASDAAARRMEALVARDPAVEHAGGFTGIDSNGLSPTPPNAGALRVRLRPSGQRAGYEDISAHLRDRLGAAVPSAVYDFRQILEDIINDLSGAPAPIDIAVSGPDQHTLIALAQRIASRIGTVKGVVDAASGVTYDSPSIRVAPRGNALAALGLTASDVGDALAAQRQGTIATQLPGTQRMVPVRVLVGSGTAGVDASAQVVSKNGIAALGDVATLTAQRLSSDITTENGQPQIRVTANFSGSSLSSVTSGIQRELRDIAMPPGYTATIGGQARSQAESFAQFADVIGIAIALVFAVMLATFRSYRLPLVILTTIPLALIGVALGLFVTGTHINVSSFMGLLLLVGLVVKNGILLIDVANRRRSEGASVHDALLAAGTTRLRPIVMTTLAAIGGLFPLALRLGQGSEMEQPLAIAVIGGLSTATIFTLIVIPVLYAVFVGRAAPAVRALTATSALLACVLLAGTPARAQSTGAQASAFSALSLDAAERAAVAASPDVRAARAQVDEARFAFDATRSGVAPSIVSSYVQVPQGNPPGPNITSRQVTTGLQWTLGDFLGYGTARRQAALTFAAAQSDEEAAENNERVKAAGLYFDALKARAVAAARRSALDLANAQRDAATVRVKAGDAPQLDVLRSDVGAAKAEADWQTAVAADQNASEALAAETGLDVQALQATTNGTPAPIPAALLDPQNAAALARRLRPEIASARLTAQAAQAAIGAARIAQLPAVTVSGGYLTGTDSGVPVNAPSVNANVTIPLGPGAHDKTAAASAKAVEAAAKAASIERQIALDVAASARTLGAAQRAADAMARARAAAEAELTAVNVGYRNGASSSLELATARSTYAQAVVDELSARYDLEKARRTLEIEVGR